MRCNSKGKQSCCALMQSTIGHVHGSMYCPLTYPVSNLIFAAFAQRYGHDVAHRGAGVPAGGCLRACVSAPRHGEASDNRMKLELTRR